MTYLAVILYWPIPAKIQYPWCCSLCLVVSNSATPWTVACQASLSMGFSRQEHWSGLPCPPPGGSSQPRGQTQVSGIAGRFFTIWITREAHEYWNGDLPNPGIEPGSPALQEDSLPAELPGKPIHPTYSGPKCRCLYYPYYHFFGHSSR